MMMIMQDDDEDVFQMSWSRLGSSNNSNNHNRTNSTKRGLPSSFVLVSDNHSSEITPMEPFVFQLQQHQHQHQHQSVEVSDDDDDDDNGGGKNSHHSDLPSLDADDDDHNDDMPILTSLEDGTVTEELEAKVENTMEKGKAAAAHPLTPPEETESVALVGVMSNSTSHRRRSNASSSTTSKQTLLTHNKGRRRAKSATATAATTTTTTTTTTTATASVLRDCRIMMDSSSSSNNSNSCYDLVQGEDAPKSTANHHHHYRQQQQQRLRQHRRQLHRTPPSRSKTTDARIASNESTRLSLQEAIKTKRRGSLRIKSSQSRSHSRSKSKSKNKNGTGENNHVSSTSTSTTSSPAKRLLRGSLRRSKTAAETPVTTTDTAAAAAAAATTDCDTAVPPNQELRTPSSRMAKLFGRSSLNTTTTSTAPTTTATSTRRTLLRSKTSDERFLNVAATPLRSFSSNASSLFGKKQIKSSTNRRSSSRKKKRRSTGSTTTGGGIGIGIGIGNAAGTGPGSAMMMIESTKLNIFANTDLVSREFIMSRLEELEQNSDIVKVELEDCFTASFDQQCRNNGHDNDGEDNDNNEDQDQKQRDQLPLRLRQILLHQIRPWEGIHFVDELHISGRNMRCMYKEFKKRRKYFLKVLGGVCQQQVIPVAHQVKLRITDDDDVDDDDDDDDDNHDASMNDLSSSSNSNKSRVSTEQKIIALLADLHRDASVTTLHLETSSATAELVLALAQLFSLKDRTWETVTLRLTGHDDSKMQRAAERLQQVTKMNGILLT